MSNHAANDLKPNPDPSRREGRRSASFGDVPLSSHYLLFISTSFSFVLPFIFPLNNLYFPFKLPLFLIQIIFIFLSIPPYLPLIPPYLPLSILSLYYSLSSLHPPLSPFKGILPPLSTLLFSLYTLFIEKYENFYLAT